MARNVRQLHVWVTESDYARLATLATERDVTRGAVVRSLIRQASPGARLITPAGTMHPTARDKRWSPKS